MYKIYANNITDNNWLRLLEIRSNKIETLKEVRAIKRLGHMTINDLPIEDKANIRLYIENEKKEITKCGGLKFLTIINTF